MQRDGSSREQAVLSALGEDGGPAERREQA